MSTSNFCTQRHFDLYASTMTYEEIDEDGNPTGEEEFDDMLYDDAKYFIDNTLNPQLKYFKITLASGYYTGVQTLIENNDDRAFFNPLWFLNHSAEYTGKEIFEEFGINKYIFERSLNKEVDFINNKLLPQLKEYTFDRYVVTAHFSNGETWYSKA